MMRVWCEAAALTGALRALQSAGRIAIVAPAEDAVPGAVQDPAATRPRVQDLNLRVADQAEAGYRGSAQYEGVLAALGFEHRREARLVDSAWREQCAVFVTRDPDILRRRAPLEALTGMRFLHADRDQAQLAALLAAGPAA